jgi:hypothetical protein
MPVSLGLPGEFRFRCLAMQAGHGPGRGLVLLIQTNGSKWWRFRYRWQGIEQMLSMGTYADTPLLEARARRDVARQQVAKGIDPRAERRRGGDPVD